MKVTPQVKVWWNNLNNATPQLWEWALAGALLLYVIYAKYPQQLPVIAFKAAQFCAAVYIAHLIDIRFFGGKKTQEAEPRDMVMAAKELARAIVFLGTVLALSLGI